MKSMNRYENGIIILIYKFDNLMHSSLVILHPDKPSEHSHSIIYMDNIITY